MQCLEAVEKICKICPESATRSHCIWSSGPFFGDGPHQTPFFSSNLTWRASFSPLHPWNCSQP